MKSYIAMTMLLAFFIITPEAFSKNKKEPTLKKKIKSKVIYKKKTEIDFSGENIEGDYKKPEGFHMVHRASASFSEIIKFDLRFKDRVRKSVGYLE